MKLRTLSAVAALTTATAVAVPVAAAHASGTPSPGSNSHLNVRIPVTCDGQQLLVVAGDSAHAAAQIVAGGTGHLIPVSITFTAPDGSTFVDQAAAHPRQQTITCSGTDMSGSGMTVTIVAVRRP